MSNEIQAGEVLTFEGVDVYTKNFDGNKFGPGGQPSIGFFVSEEAGRELEERGLPGLKWTKEREDAPDGWVSQPWVKASIGFGFRPPTIVQITSRGGRRLNEHTVGGLQEARIDGPIDISVRVAAYEFNGATGLKLWVTEAYIKIEETPLAAKYGHLIEEGEDYDDE